MGCRKAQEFLETNKLRPVDREDASKKPRSKAEALALARTVDRIVAAKGKKTVTIDMNKQRPDDDTLLGHLLGPTGNLRAPAIRKGKTLLVGFNPEVYQALLKKSK
jgi:arsenate reductase-like glutaredoxin family protein